MAEAAASGGAAAPGGPGTLPAFFEVSVAAHWRSVDFISDLHLCEAMPRTFEAWAAHLHHTPADAVINLTLKEQTESVLKTLTPREEKVIKMRFGVGDGSEHTLEEVGQNFAVTRERIRQIEAKALRKLRHPSRSRKLKAFLEGRT